MKQNRWLLALALCLLALVGLFTMHLGPHVLGDTQTYIDAMNVLSGHAAPAGFIPNRIITTFGALEAVRALSVPLGGILNGWFVLNCGLFILAGIVFFKLLEDFFGSRPAAFLGTLFLAGNYGFLVFGLNYLMDIGGWSFYIFSLYFLWRYARSKSQCDLFLAAAMVGIGGLLKEYAFLAGVATAAYLIAEAWPGLRSWPGWKRFLGRSSCAAAVALVPAIVLYVWAYHHFGYTYADWFGSNAAHYIYSSRIKEYVKALGSLVNVLGLLFIGGAYILYREWRAGIMEKEARTFLAACFVSFLPVFIWPAITQRILTIAIPFIAIVACFLFRKYERRWYAFVPILALYLLATFFMDSYLLTAVNLPF
ncbi:MAG: hypothetical protein JWO00_435 [Candidatus Parcubacteria bacterium]|nr:hypothetical protein [Candidatus Parcubacteria bacterium]